MAIEKIKVLVDDDKGHFLKMFSKELTDEFEFMTNSFAVDSQVETLSFDRFISVVYNKLELIDFLALEKKGSNILVCLFNKRLYSNTPFIEEINDLIVLGGYKTKKTIIKDLKSHLKESYDSKNQSNKVLTSDSYKNQIQFHSFFKTVFFLI
ncbi:hypothetical protein NJT12_11670 [Flavobacterium sp. AC]|uniref:Uncharacterized protein n=1 Tax=Flavobacterium azizsancarii TaxID=2961580 RepID=A0ABT4WDG2_9FLAO|nr:hypothetical protein [Flavobacterium azizsancarii]MDA6070277.1 hypothetical protein [Flavobacterium azizsancarii]